LGAGQTQPTGKASQHDFQRRPGTGDSHKGINTIVSLALWSDGNTGFAQQPATNETFYVPDCLAYADGRVQPRGTMSAECLSTGYQTMMPIDPFDKRDGRPRTAAVSDQDTVRVSHISSLFVLQNDREGWSTGWPEYI
jgi:hypothetical protein